MPIDYKKYPPNWKTEIRPRILERANNCCENCLVKNYEWIIRGINCYQKLDGAIFNMKSELITYDYVGSVSNKKPIKIILTIAHLDHDIKNNDLSNLKALCQKCHLDYDKNFHAENRRKTQNAKQGLSDLFG